MNDKEIAQDMIETFLEIGDINELEDINLYYDGDILDLLEENGLFWTVHFFNKKRLTKNNDYGIIIV